MVFSVIRKANAENTMIINNLSGEKLDIIMVFVASFSFHPAMLSSRGHFSSAVFARLV